MKHSFITSKNQGLAILIYWADRKGKLTKFEINRYLKHPFWSVHAVVDETQAKELLIQLLNK